MTPARDVRSGSRVPVSKSEGEAGQSKSDVWNCRVKESLGIVMVGVVMVGDGLLATIGPVRYCLLWQRGPSGWRRIVSFFARRTGLTRVVGVAETGAGLWLASRQRSS